MNNLNMVHTTVVFCALLILLHIESFAQNLSQYQPPDVAVADYNFVPENQLQTGDFRSLMKIKSSVLDVSRQNPNIDLSDYTTQILPAEIRPEPERITENLQFPPIGEEK